MKIISYSVFIHIRHAIIQPRAMYTTGLDIPARQPCCKNIKKNADIDRNVAIV
jgi:hypothetical protein